MIIENYIANDFPILGVDTTAEEALQTAVDFDFTHVFVENEGVFQGAVMKECLEENRKKKCRVSSGKYSIYPKRLSPRKLR